MKKLILFLFVIISLTAASQNLPEGVTKTSTPCTLSKGLSYYQFNKDNMAIAIIEPSDCNFSSSEGPKPPTTFKADFFPTSSKMSFKTNDEALKWILSSMDAYFKPVVIAKWLKLDNNAPKASLNYPSDWTFKSVKQDWIFKTPGPGNDRLILMLNSSEMIQIIRTPNTGKLTTKQFMDNSARMNPAINFNTNPVTDIVIDGKTFKTMEHTFAMMMLQKHYWYTDEKEVIYIGVGLLRDDKIRYPIVVSDIIKSIKW
jgi:hypothetical protein